MKVRYLGYSCVEIIGQHHILIDPDFTRPPEPGIDYICISHAHKDHIGWVAELPTGLIVASSDVCEIATEMGVSRERLKPVNPGEHVANIQILTGYSQGAGFVYKFFYILFRRRLPEPGGTPLSFLIKDEATLLHIGDAHDAPLPVRPDILCLPWRTTPFRAQKFKEIMIRLANQFDARYVLPIHYDLPYSEADPLELRGTINAEVLDSDQWHHFHQKTLVKDVG